MADDSVTRRNRIRRLQKRVVNPLVRAAVFLRLAPGDQAVIETTGRRSGLPRCTPVGVHLDGDVAWIVAEHGRHADYVRNLEAYPRVRLFLHRRWRTGSARVVPDDDPRLRLAAFRRRSHRAAVRRFGTDLLTVRVDLDPVS